MKKLMEAMSVSSKELTGGKKKRLVNAAKRASDSNISRLNGTLDDLDDKEELLFESTVHKSFKPEEFALKL